MLIDTHGTIVFKGHPANRSNLEEDFDTLLKGEKITGPGTEAADAPKDGEAAPEGKELDSANCLKNIDEFKSTHAPGLQANEGLKEHTAKMQRAFCVMVYTETYNVKDKKSLVDWKNYRVLVGPQDAINACKEQIEAVVKGEFEIVLREHAI